MSVVQQQYQPYQEPSLPERIAAEEQRLRQQYGAILTDQEVADELKVRPSTLHLAFSSKMRRDKDPIWRYLWTHRIRVGRRRRTPAGAVAVVLTGAVGMAGGGGQ